MQFGERCLFIHSVCQFPIRKKRKTRYESSFCKSGAERTGFEPANQFCRLHAFQACLFNHSSTFPEVLSF